MKISLGPIQFFWPAEKIREFYRTVESAPVDIVYLGETVCSKRRELGFADWQEIGQSLEAAGKEVVYSTLALVEAQSELKMMDRICRESSGLVEANDYAGVQMRAEKDMSFVTGPAINLYNAESIKRLAKTGLKRWVMPVELGKEALKGILEYKNDFSDVETEVFVFGHMPLAFSARCFTARNYDLPKDDCQLKCLDFPEGMALSSKEDELLFTVNGIQTMSGIPVNYLSFVNDMKDMGVDIIRISPIADGTLDVVDQFQKALQGELFSTTSSDFANGYWLGESGMAWKSQAESVNP